MKHDVEVINTRTLVSYFMTVFLIKGLFFFLNFFFHFFDFSCGQSDVISYIGIISKHRRTTLHESDAILPRYMTLRFT